MLGAAKSCRNDLFDQFRISYGREFNQPNTAWVFTDQLAGRLQRKTGLAAPSRASQRQKPCGPQSPLECGYVVAPPHEISQLVRKVVIEFVALLGRSL